MHRNQSFVVVCALLWTGVAAAGDKLAEVEKKLEAAFANLKSYTSDYKSTVDMAFGAEFSQKSVTTGKSEWLREGDKLFYRMESETTSETKQGDQTTKTDQKTVTVSDGEFVWVLTDSAGRKNASKTRVTAASFSPKGVLDGFRSYFEISVLPDEDVDGRSCAVLELKAKQTEGMPAMGRQVLYFDNATGINLRMVGFDAEGKAITETMTKNVKLNAKIDKGRFKFEIPAGVQVQDMTGESPAGQP